MKKILIALTAVFALSGCTEPENATRILEQNGYTNVQITGYAWLSCSDKDTFQTGFIAKSPSGHTVKGAVCSGLLFKNSTIRFD